MLLTVILCDPPPPPLIMNITCNNITDKTLDNWNRFLENHPENTVFQSPEMFAFYQKVNNFTPYVFIAENEQKEITGVLLAVLIKEGKGIKGYFSSRAVIYGGPLIQKNNNAGVLNGLLSALVKKLKNKTIFIQFRNFFQWNDDEKQIFQSHGFTFRDRLNLLVDTSSENAFWKGLSESRKRQLKKGLKNKEIKITDPFNEGEVREFYQLLYKLYKIKIKKPLPDFSFFQAFYGASKAGHLGIIRLVKVNDRIVGGILSPVTPGKNIYEWYITGLDKEYKNYFPSIMATWASIDYALHNKLEYFDFMGLGVPYKKYGVRDFKLKFGGEQVNFGRFARRNNKKFYLFAEFGYNIFRFFKLV